MVTRGDVRVAAAAVLAVACGLETGCSSPKPAPKPPAVIVPGVVSGGSGASGGSSGGAAGAYHGEVVLGGWAPGGARDPVAAGALAYFQWLNAHGGVYGRKIVYRVLDDRGSVRVVPSLAHRLVQGDAVFAVFGAVGAQGGPTMQFLSSSGVPDVFSITACACVDDPAHLPEVFGWSLGEFREGKILGAYVVHRFPGQKVAVLYTPDQAGKAELAGFKDTARGVKVAVRAGVAVSADVNSRVTASKKSKVSVLVAFTASNVTTAISSTMAAKALGVPLVAADAGMGSGLPDGVITDGFLPSAAASPQSAAGSWVALFRKIHAKYLTHSQLTPAVIDGMSAAYELAAALFRAGPNLSREGLIAGLNGIPAGPSAAPFSYTPADHSGAEGAYLGVLRQGSLVPVSGVMITDSTPSGPVLAYSTQQQPAPSGGIPPR